jgi:hypothetical protein
MILYYLHFNAKGKLTKKDKAFFFFYFVSGTGIYIIASVHSIMDLVG